jgi:hypothetical protein
LETLRAQAPLAQTDVCLSAPQHAHAPLPVHRPCRSPHAHRRPPRPPAG